MDTHQCRRMAVLHSHDRLRYGVGGSAHPRRSGRYQLRIGPRAARQPGRPVTLVATPKQNRRTFESCQHKCPRSGDGIPCSSTGHSRPCDRGRAAAPVVRGDLRVAAHHRYRRHVLSRAARHQFRAWSDALWVRGHAPLVSDVNQRLGCVGAAASVWTVAAGPGDVTRPAGPAGLRGLGVPARHWGTRHRLGTVARPPHADRTYRPYKSVAISRSFLCCRVRCDVHIVFWHLAERRRSIPGFPGARVHLRMARWNEDHGSAVDGFDPGGLWRPADRSALSLRRASDCLARVANCRWTCDDGVYWCRRNLADSKLGQLRITARAIRPGARSLDDLPRRNIPGRRLLLFGPQRSARPHRLRSPGAVRHVQQTSGWRLVRTRRGWRSSFRWWNSLSSGADGCRGTS